MTAAPVCESLSPRSAGVSPLSAAHLADCRSLSITSVAQIHGDHMYGRRTVRRRIADPNRYRPDDSMVTGVLSRKNYFFKLIDIPFGPRERNVVFSSGVDLTRFKNAAISFAYDVVS
jgi:hypothetical protein